VAGAFWGRTQALILARPFRGWGLFELIRYRKFQLIALRGVISVFPDGGIGLMKR